MKLSFLNFNKVVAYLDILEEMGTRVGEPVTKHLDGEIWDYVRWQTGYYMPIIRTTSS